ncbi:hypothetical protein [Enterococcus malodoratus]|uniref:hypothetical protein n=1 Tax=Enterococcus malodoratus TaxID=71451 RepID=UPI002074AA4B|nr:hypothetical protein [Enterococcus malodoratus]
MVFSHLRSFYNCFRGLPYWYLVQLTDCIYSFIYGNPKDIVTQIWSELNEKEEGQVLEAFGKWAQEQEED